MSNQVARGPTRFGAPDYYQTDLPLVDSGFFTNDFSVPANTDTKLVWDIFSTTGDIVHSSGVFTIQRKGVYCINVTIPWTADTVGDRTLWMRINGDLAFKMLETDGAAATGVTSQNINFNWLFQDNDIFELYVRHSSTTDPLPIIGFNTNQNTYGQIDVVLLAGTA